MKVPSTYLYTHPTCNDSNNSKGRSQAQLTKGDHGSSLEWEGLVEGGGFGGRWLAPQASPGVSGKLFWVAFVYSFGS